MILELAALGFMAGQFIYFRWLEDKPLKSSARQEVLIPSADDGAPVSLIYGRVRVRNPILAWHSTPTYEVFNITSVSYAMNMFFVLGIPFDDGNGINRIHGMWAGDFKLGGLSDPGILAGNGSETPAGMATPTLAGSTLGDGQLEFLNGNPAQEVVNGLGTSTFAAGIKMLASGTGGGGLNFNNVPGYRGYMSAFLFNSLNGGWYYGESASVPPYSFEASSYRDAGGYPATGAAAMIGSDSNPINVLWDLFKAKFGKLGYDTSLLDLPSWQAAAQTLYSESHGYSRYITNASDADGHIQEILRQIDGVLRENPTTGKIEIKLVRADYDPATIPHITRANCDKLTNFAAGGWTNIINKVRLVYTNRARDYVDDSELVQNQANAVGQNGQVNEQTIQMPGICETTVARNVGTRELAARSRPVIKCRAYVDRSFLRVMQGDAVKVTWSNPDIAGIIFRVANVERGTIKDSMIALDLISDFYYVHRNLPPRPLDPSWWAL